MAALLTVGVGLSSAAPVEAESTSEACRRMVAVAASVGWKQRDLSTLRYIMHRESRCQSGVSHLNRNGTVDRGLLQINDVVLRDHRFRKAFPGFDSASLFDPATNLRVGLWLRSVVGWSPWRVRK